ncbi:hypothetical protein VMCG_00789 [Cytospora schulzeri]|uniref:NAD(P)-binding domain-containing protein n=1 Tax=Cytospora schulzeri TaxID=448051 RepID=A0A423XAB3_9PEZI|nr:hypothetical protein VMCG_00789 [Valsa malicola]
MHLILTGATGLVGSGVLDAMIKMKDISKISVLSRRPVAMAEDAKDPRINVIIHKDFEKYDPELLSKLKGAKGCVWALGISQTEVGTEEYVKITKTFALEAAKAFQGLAPDGEPFNFVYVSGHGATTEPGIFTSLFARVKGEVEARLAEMRRADPGFHALSARPAAVDASAHDAIGPYIPTRPLIVRVMLPVLGPPIRTFCKGLHSPTEHLGRVLTELAMGRYEDRFVAGRDVQKIGEFSILENPVLRRFAGL